MLVLNVDAYAEVIVFLCAFLWLRRFLFTRTLHWRSHSRYFETLPDTGDDNDYDLAIAKLDEYFTPQKNIDYEISKFRTASQLSHETLDQFATRLRKFASTCEFTDIGKEVKSVIIQNCLSKRLRCYALLELDLTLDKLLAKGRAFEVSKSQATGIEEALTSTKMSENNVHFVKSCRPIHVLSNCGPHTNQSSSRDLPKHVAVVVEHGPIDLHLALHKEKIV